MEEKLANEKEMKERASKELNVCFFNIPEAEDGTSAENACKEDVIKVQNILSGKIILTKQDVKALYRVGHPSKEVKRPVVMKLASLEKKIEVLKLRNLKFNLKKEDDGTEDENEEEEEENEQERKKENSNAENIKQKNYIDIYVSPDRTYQQQNEHRKLVAEFKERRDIKKEKNIYIRNGKIVKDLSFRIDPQ